MRSLRHNDGFTLIELIVAIGVLAITGTALFVGFTNSARTHAKTTTLQMSEDVGQAIAEEFKSHSITWLKSKYSANLNEIKDAEGNVTELDFENVPFTYSARSEQTASNFLVNITLTPVDDASKPGLGTTYQQNRDVTYFYEIDDKVSTNTFIMPEITNIYDGTCVVISDDINQYDSRVVNDLYQVVKNSIETINATQSLAVNQIDVSQMDSAFSAIYIPLTNIDTNKRLIKTTEIEVVSDAAGDSAVYSYVVTVSYEFNFDFDLVLGSGLSAGSLSSVVPSGILSAVDGATSTYEVKHSGSKYTVTYSELLSADETGQTGLVGSFGGLINVDSDLSTEEIEPKYTYKKDGSGTDQVAYLYILYTPFDLYSDQDGGIANDVIKFNYSGSVSSNIVRAFLVTQELTALGDPEETVKVENCEYTGNKDIFKVYTNSSEIIDNTIDSPDVKKEQYLTNSYGKSTTNYYELKIEMYDTEGNYKGEFNTFKED